MASNKLHSLIYCLIIILKVHASANGITENEDTNADEEYIYPENGEIQLPENYDKFKIPSPKMCNEFGNAVNVSVEVIISSIGNIDELKEQIEVEMSILLSWIDYAIWEQNNTDCTKNATSVYTLSPEFSNKIWLPDLHIENVIDVRSQNIINKPARLLIANNGVIFYNTRATVTLNCPLNFLYYPADTQICDVLLSSYSYRSYQMRLSWYGNGIYFPGGSSTDFIRVVDNPQEIKGGVGDTYLQAIGRYESFDRLKFQIKLGRRISHHLASLYVPTMLYVWIVWISYLVPSSYRISIAMTILLTLTSKFAVVNQNIPAAGYIKAIDIYMFSGIFYVFLTLAVFAVLLWNEVTQDNKQLVNEDQILVTGIESYKKITNADDDQSNFQQNKNMVFDPLAFHQIKFSNQRILVKLKRIFQEKQMKYAVLTAKFIESNSFIIHIVGFMVFNIVYWSWLFIGAGYFNWKVDSWGRGIYVE